MTEGLYYWMGRCVCVGWHDAFGAGVLKLSHLTSELSLDPNLPLPFPLFFPSSLSLSPLCAPLSLQCSFSLVWYGVWRYWVEDLQHALGGRPTTCTSTN